MRPLTRDRDGRLCAYGRSSGSAAPDPDFLYKLTRPRVLGADSARNPGRATSGRARSPAPARTASPSQPDASFASSGTAFFREWSHAAQPNGNPDRIVWRVMPSFEAGTPGGRSEDVPTGSGRSSAARGRERCGLDPRALHAIPPSPSSSSRSIRTRAPFNDVRVRQALNYAIDRSRIARMYGGPRPRHRCASHLRPGFPAIRRYCPYTAHPTRDGRWSAPDVARAKRLIAASGGGHVDIWAASDRSFVPRAVPRYIAAVLRSLGYRTQLHRIPYARLHHRACVGASSCRSTATGCRTTQRRRRTCPNSSGATAAPTGSGYVCDPRLDRRMRRASALEVEDPGEAATLWADIDHELVDRAVWVPTVNVGVTEFVSRRLRNYEYHPVLGFLAAQAWLN